MTQLSNYWYRNMKRHNFASLAAVHTVSLASLPEVVGVLIERYEEDHVPELTEE